MFLAFSFFNFTGIGSILSVNVNLLLNKFSIVQDFVMLEVSKSKFFDLAQGFKQDFIETDGTVIRCTVCNS